MIPQAYLQEWSTKAPWPDLRQVEQDLVICRALCDLFNAPDLAGKIAFRGGTAINKLLFRQPLRYSEDIGPLLPTGVLFNDDDAIEAFGRVWTQLIVHVQGEPWKLSDKAIEELRQKKYPNLLRGGIAGG